MKNYICILILILLSVPCLSGFTDDEPEIKVEKEWKAIIAYFPGSPEETTEDWIFFLFDIEEHYNANENIYFIGIYSGDNRIVPIGPGDNSITNIDISEFAGDVAGYIFVMNGKSPMWCDYMPSFMVIEKSDHYFYGTREEEGS